MRRSTLAAAVGALAVSLIGCDAVLGLHAPEDRVADGGGSLDDASPDVVALADSMSDDTTLAPGDADAGAVDAIAGNADATAGDGGDDGAALGDAPPDGVTGCGSGQLACGGGCFGQTDVQHCGSCTNDCTQQSNVSAAGLACMGGQCIYQCAPAFADCADAGAGCPTYLGNSPNCGACGVACSGNTPFCVPAPNVGTFACGPNCLPSAPTPCNGACVNERTDKNNCGGCGAAYACSGAQSCQAGVCGCLPCVLDQSNLDQCCLQ
jgi:hypothetical protein